ncbi:Inactive serine/threonine-protein kinase plk5 [Linnemannia elongata]|nr:Inactive serine/threonine-protein kinase plk5 [Linnemannia elongata]
MEKINPPPMKSCSKIPVCSLVASARDGKRFTDLIINCNNRAGPFQREIDILGAAGKHDSLVKYFGLVNDPSGEFPLLELCRPLDLFGFLCSRDRLTYPEVRYFGLGITAGLAHLHDKGIIHRDLKPENVFISFDVQVRVGDLGLAARDQSFPNQLENVLFENKASSDPEKVLISDTQDLRRTLLSFHPRARPEARHMALQTFFAMGHCPTNLHEEVFYTPYKSGNKNKRKKAPAQDEEETRAVQKVKYEYDCD